MQKKDLRIEEIKKNIMSVLFLDQRKNVKYWLKALKKALPNTKIEAYPQVEKPEEVEFIITMKPKKEVIDRFPNAKVIQSFGAGVDHILAEKVLKKGVILARVVDPYLTEDMFEFILTGVLIQMKCLPIYINQQKKGLWKPREYKRIQDITIAILGLGKIGGTVGMKLAALGFRVKGWSNSAKNLIGVNSFIGKENLADCLADAHFLVNILPATPRTFQILNRNNLQYLPQGAFLINVGRGSHMHEADLLHLLNEKQLSGVLLDVFNEEPLRSDHFFWEHPKVLLTPHIASRTNPDSAAQQIGENYRRFKANLPLENVVELVKGY